MTSFRHADALPRQPVFLRRVLANTLEYLSMKQRMSESNWRRPHGRVAYAWQQNHWIVSHLLGPQAQQMQDDGRAVAAIDVAQAFPAAITGKPSKQRQRVEAGAWENEGGAVGSAMLAPAYGGLEE